MTVGEFKEWLYQNGVSDETELWKREETDKGEEDFEVEPAYLYHNLMKKRLIIK